MRRGRVARALYWDASALLPVLLRDIHSVIARRIARDGRTAHLVSSLGLAEVHAVIARLEREQALTATQADDLRRRFAVGPWRRSAMQPRPEMLERFARRHALRGADLWHLGAAAALAELLPGLQVLTFDDRLGMAARNEGLSHSG